MSGGAYDYATFKATRMAQELRGRDTDPLRRAFADHLGKVADAMYEVEWVDSGDKSPGDEAEAIRAVLAPGAELEAATEMAKEAHRALGELLARVSPLLLFAALACSDGPVRAVAVEEPAVVQVQSASSRPSVLVILLDDVRADMVTRAWMPRTFDRLADSGRVFTRAYANTPLCCPSRATLFSGLWTHNHGVLANGGGSGGFGRFADVSTVATQMQGAGYVTALVGKYLNQYDNGVRPVPWPYIPPGWDEWQVVRNSNAYPQNFYGNTFVERPTGSAVTETSFGSDPASYNPSVIGRKAIDFIQRAPASSPFFLVLTPYTGHKPYTPAAQDIGRCHDAGAFRPPSYYEADRSDQPSWIATLPPLPSGELAKIDTAYRRLCESLYSQDRVIDSVLTALATANRLDDTYVVLTSDHGLVLGEHQVPEQKGVLLEEALHVPFIVRGPGVLVGTDTTSFVQLADLMPTAMQIAGAVPVPSNGASVLAQWHGSPIGAKSEVFFEHLDPGSGVLYKRGWGVRDARWFYVRPQWTSQVAQQQLYDMWADPYQMVNLATNPAYTSIRTALLNKVTAFIKQ